MSAIDDVFAQLEPAPTVVKQTKPRRRSETKSAPGAELPDGADGGVSLDDFYAYMPQHAYLFVPTRELWPATSVNGRLPWPKASSGKAIKPSDWLDRNKPIEQMTWHPALPELIYNKVMQVSGWASHAGAAVFNLYRPPNSSSGDASKAGPWIAHLRRVYPTECDHIERWLAHRVQFPGDKVNHALVLGGAQGIGKDTILEPVKEAVGAWNWQDVSPAQMLGRFNGWAKAVVLRISEARDLGDVDRFAFYDHSKTYIAAPPDVIRVDEKNLREHYVTNVCGVVITTNHKTDGLYLPADDRRHFVAWSDETRDSFNGDYWTDLYTWYASGGVAHVIAHLASLDLEGFDAKAPPIKTPAFWAIVQTGEAPESGELRDIVEHLRKPALTLHNLVQGAEDLSLFDLASELKDRKTRRAIPHKLERIGYVPVRNPDADDGLFKIAGKRQAVYAIKSLAFSEQIKAARLVSQVG